MKRKLLFLVLVLCLIFAGPAWADNIADANSISGAQATAISGQGGAVENNIGIGISTNPSAIANGGQGGTGVGYGGDAGASAVTGPSSATIGDVSSGSASSVGNVGSSSSSGVGDTSATIGDVQTGPSSASVEGVDGGDVSIDSHNTYKSKSINRQFMPAGVYPIGGVMQDFVSPKEFGHPWNFQKVVDGNWQQSGKMSKIKVEKIKIHRYSTSFPCQKKVQVVTKDATLEGTFIGEIVAKATSKEDSRSLQMALVDKLASWGANVMTVEVNSIEYSPKSSYSGVILGGSAGGVFAYEERAAASGGGGIGKGSTQLKVEYYPVVHIKGYYGKATVALIVPEKTEEQETQTKNHRKEWQAIH